ncbi:hypothetical protein MOK15_07125 [Sphingobium sp. BYY-5]|uniref:hypothetical protein n=1 Tax=Sphingobium sp. BYY-5 TaxID=2926400 RepID=UPI001FA79E05|nr:hypothetical protein [Sphingobium sp. BYY-5]MCI4589861.1 hypothetical protein [Sphingobium sp. BYY-5]
MAGSGKFTGDITFNDCQFQSQADGHYAAYLNSYSTVGAQYATQLRGIRFNHCVFYGGQTFVACSTNGQTADIWFNNCAWDANNRPIAIVVDVNQNGQMNKIMFSDFYIVGYDRGFIFSKNTTESQVANVKIQSGMIGGVQQPIYFVGMSGFDVQNCTFDGCISPYALINIDQDCQRFKISDNMEANSNGSYIISIIGPNTNKFSCSNNVCYDMGSVIRDMTGSVSKQVNNNSKL